MARAGFYLGWGRGASNGDEEWTDDQIFHLTDFVNSACRRVYQAAIEGKTYDWSWMRPVSTITLKSGQSTLKLPDDFGGLEGTLVLVPTAGLCVYPVQITNEQIITARLAEASTTTGMPKMAAIQWLKQTGTDTGQRAQLVFFPVADQDYSFRVNYYLLPNALSDASPYALGGENLSEVYLEGVLAVAEQRLDNIPEDSPAAVHQPAFKRLLAAAIDQDRRNKPQVFGRNRDRADDLEAYTGSLRRGQEAYVTFDSVLYGPSGV